MSRGERWGGPRIAITCAVLALSLSGMPSAATAVPSVAASETQLTFSGGRFDPYFWGDMVVYTGSGRTWVYDPATGRETVTSASPSDDNLQVWEEEVSDPTEFRLWHVLYASRRSTGEVRNVSGECPSFTGFATHGDRVAWGASRHREDDYICIYDWATRDTQVVFTSVQGTGSWWTSILGGMDMSDDRIVWEQCVDGFGWDIFARELEGPAGIRRLGMARTQRPRVDADGVTFGHTDQQGDHLKLWHLPTGGVFELAAPQGTNGDIEHDMRMIDPLHGRVVYQDIRDGACDIYLTKFEVTGLPFAAEPWRVHFGETRTRSTHERRVTVRNVGEEPAVVEAITLDATGGLTLTRGATGTIPPGGSVEMTLTYAPVTAGSLSTTLTVQTHDPYQPSVVVPVSGTSAWCARDLASRLRGFVATAASSGRLRGVYGRRTSTRRLRGFMALIARAETLVRQRRLPEALRTLRIVSSLCDGRPKPADAVDGPARAELAYKVYELGVGVTSEAYP